MTHLVAGNASGNTSRILDTGLMGDCAVSSSTTICASRELPKGDWKVSYRAVVNIDALLAKAYGWSCSMRLDGTTVDRIDGNALIGGGAIDLVAAVSVPSASIVDIICVTPQRDFVASSQRLTASDAASVESW